MQSITGEIEIPEPEHDPEHFRAFADALTQRESPIQALSKLDGGKALGCRQQQTTDALNRDFVAVAFPRIRQLGQQSKRLVNITERSVVGGTRPRLLRGT